MKGGRTTRVLGAAALAAALSIVAWWWLTGTGGPADAEPLATGKGSMTASVIYRDDDEPEDVEIGDVRYGDASLIRPASGDTFWMLVAYIDRAGAPFFDTDLLQTSSDGSLGARVKAPNVVGSGSETTSIGIDRTGGFLLSAERQRVGQLGVSFLQYNPFCSEIREVRLNQGSHYICLDFDVDAIGFTSDGGLLLASTDYPRIDLYTSETDDFRSLERRVGDIALTSEPKTRRLLGNEDDPEAAVAADHELGRVVAMQVLSDDRIVFVSDSRDGRQLYLFDDDSVRQIAPDVPDLVRAEHTDPAPEPYRKDRKPIDPINLTADDKITAIGQNADGDPVVYLVDPDTDSVRILAELDGVEPSFEEPVSAVLLGDDLVFLAEGTLWKLEDATG